LLCRLHIDAGRLIVTRVGLNHMLMTSTNSTSKTGINLTQYVFDCFYLLSFISVLALESFY